MRKLMLGNEAFARGLYEAGCKVVSSYPGTPSTEITEEVAKYDEVYAEWSPNEKVALEVAIRCVNSRCKKFLRNETRWSERCGRPIVYSVLQRCECRSCNCRC